MFQNVSKDVVSDNTFWQYMNNQNTNFPYITNLDSPKQRIVLGMLLRGKNFLELKKKKQLKNCVVISCKLMVMLFFKQWGSSW